MLLGFGIFSYVLLEDPDIGARVRTDPRVLLYYVSFYIKRPRNKKPTSQVGRSVTLTLSPVQKIGQVKMDLGRWQRNGDGYKRNCYPSTLIG